MSNHPVTTALGTALAGQLPVSPNNPCPFLRALVANGYVGGHIVPLPKLAETKQARHAARTGPGSE